MDDERVWGSEAGLRTDRPENYQATTDDEFPMVRPVRPLIVPDVERL